MIGVMAGKKDFKITPIEEEGPEGFGVQPAPLSAGLNANEPITTVRELAKDSYENNEDDEDEDEVEPISSRDLRAVSDVGATQSGKIAISFEKFVQLLTAHDFETTMHGHKKKDIIIDIDLLADLATPQADEEPQRRLPMMFALGLLVGGVVVFILVKLLT